LVDWSTKSICVKTPIVLVPSLSTYLANFNDYEFAESSIALVTATTIQFGFLIYPFIILTTCYSMSFGWSPIGFFIIPGKSTRRRSKTFLE